MADDKVRYGLKNVYYAVLDEVAGTYSAPVAMPGAVATTLAPVGEVSERIADNIVFFEAHGNNGYDGTFELTIVPETFREACMCYKADADGVVFEDDSIDPVPFALLFEFKGDQNDIKCVLYKCVSEQDSIEGTTTMSYDTKTETITIEARPNADGYVKARSTSTTSSATLAAWYTSVYEYAE